MLGGVLVCVRCSVGVCMVGYWCVCNVGVGVCVRWGIGVGMVGCKVGVLVCVRWCVCKVGCWWDVGVDLCLVGGSHCSVYTCV